MKNLIRHMFPGANSPAGFFSYFEHIIPLKSAKHVFCIKGGPGVGKSTFMKRIGRDMEKEGILVEYMHCSSDPDSLDGVVMPDMGIAFIDGTAPHVVDPKYPCAVDEIINLGMFWDEQKIIKNKDNMITLFSEISGQFSNAYCYLAAAGNIKDNIIQEKMKKIDIQMLDGIASDIIDNEVNGRKSAKVKGSIRKLFATAITPNGLSGHIETLSREADRVYVLKDDTGCGSGIILDTIIEAAVRRGLFVEAFYCPMNPTGKVEHIIIPELGCAICTSNHYHSVDPLNTEMIMLDAGHSKDMSNKEAVFNLLLDNALEELSKAKQMHDELETYYVPYMDFDSMEAFRQKIMARITQYN